MSSQRSNAFVADIVDLVVSSWKILAVCIAVAVGAAVVYVWRATPLYAVKMQVRPGITAFDETGKEIRSWNVGDVMDFFRQDAYRAFLPNEGGAAGKTLTLYPAQGRSATTVTLTLYYPDPDEGVRLLQQFYDNVLRHYQTSGKEPLIAVSTKKIQERIQSVEGLLNHVDAVERPTLDGEIEGRRAQIAAKTRVLEAVENRIRDMAGMRPDPQVFSVLLEHEKSAEALRSAIAEEKRLIDSLVLARDALAMKKRQLEAERALEQQKLAALVPLEQVVPPAASAFPVRPKMKWHLIGAVLAGGFAGLLLGVILRERRLKGSALR
ncbi:MAG: hypothetical protein WHS86_07970 [Desulfosoma sp.]